MSPRYIPENLEWEPVDGRIIDITEVKNRLNNHTTKVLQLNADINDFIEVEEIGSDTKLKFDVDGGSEYSDHTIILEDVTGIDLATLIADGNLEVV